MSQQGIRIESWDDWRALEGTPVMAPPADPVPAPVSTLPSGGGMSWLSMFFANLGDTFRRDTQPQPAERQPLETSWLDMFNPVVWWDQITRGDLAGQVAGNYTDSAKDLYGEANIKRFFFGLGLIPGLLLLAGIAWLAWQMWPVIFAAKAVRKSGKRKGKK